MPSFSLEQRLGSSHVTKTLLQNIEKYLSAQVPELFPELKEHIKEISEIEIIDAFGEETFNTSSEIIPDLFPDSTEEISIRIHNAYSPHIYLIVRFNRDRFRSLIKIKIERKHANAKMFAKGLYEGVTNIINQNRKPNIFFHPPVFLVYIFNTLIPFLTGMLFPLIPFLIVSHYYFYACLATMFLACFLAYYLIQRHVSPYTSFETKNQKKIDEQFGGIIKWGIALLASALITKMFWPNLLNLIKNNVK